MSTWTAGVKPNTPTSQLSDQIQRVQASVVQHQYVRAELHEINTRKGLGLVQETINLLKAMPQCKKWTDKQFVDTFLHLTKRLQTADLTINFEAPKWFMSPNNYNSYTQMYERAVRAINDPTRPGAREMRMVSDRANPAPTRVRVDDAVIFRKEMKNGTGLKPEFSGLGRVMSPGALAAPTVDAREGEFVATNPFFNPKSKQVFAALNYGRRPHGSLIYYGHSYIALNPKFKINAIYFGGDTFGVDYNLKVGADDQVSYRLLGAVYAKANDMLRRDILKSCILDGNLNDSSDSLVLLEGHLFEPLTFAGNLEAVFISAKDKIQNVRLTGDQWQNIQTNARAFANKHGAKLYFID